MFLIRSAFWLTVAFVVLHPRDMDIGQTASALSDQAMTAGRQIVAEQVLANSCSFVRCPGPAPGSAAPRAPVVETASAARQTIPSVDLTMQGSPTLRPAPVP
ncbi:MAG TPA: hypothetical protein VL418_05570, partial [Devosiaceae bacterium]|nr:hypothetical protein [Devosiaceae bacterium]